MGCDSWSSSGGRAVTTTSGFLAAVVARIGTDEQIDALEPHALGPRIGLFECFLEDGPPTTKLMVSARLKPSALAELEPGLAIRWCHSCGVGSTDHSEDHPGGGAAMPGEVTEPSAPGWPNECTAVVARSALAGCVADRGGRP